MTTTPPAGSGPPPRRVLIEMRRQRFYGGPNLYSNRSGLQLLVARNPELDAPLPADIAARLTALAGAASDSVLARMLEQVAQEAVPGKRLVDLVLAVTRAASAPYLVTPGPFAVLGQDQHNLLLLISCEDPDVGLAALWLGAVLARGVTTQLTGAADVGPAYAEIAEAAAKVALPPEALAQARQAAASDVPWVRAGDDRRALRFGHGRRGSASLDRGDPGRIPIVAVTGSLGKTSTCQLLAHIVRCAGLTPGTGTTQGIWIGESKVSDEEFIASRAGSTIFLDPEVDFAVLETQRGSMLSYGMPVDQVDVAIALNVLDNHIGTEGITSREDLVVVKSIPLRLARKAVVVNAEDPLTMKMAGMAKPQLVAMFSQSADAPALLDHRASGGLQAVIAGERLVLARGEAEILSLVLGEIPEAHGGRSVAGKAMALAASLGAHLAGIGGAAILAGLRSFVSDAAHNPGRNNRIAGFPFDVVVAKITNPQSIAELVAVLEGEAPVARRHLLYTHGGVGSEDWLHTLGLALSGHFARYFLANRMVAPGRPPEETTGLIGGGVIAGGAEPGEVIALIHAQTALADVLRRIPHGDLLVVATTESELVLEMLETERRAMAEPGIIAAGS